MLIRTLLAFAASACMGVCVAHADTFNFSFGTAGVDLFNGSGQLVGNLVSPGEYLITGISGTTNTGNGTNRPIKLLLPEFGFLLNDNILDFTNGMGSFDDQGLAYELRNGAEISLQKDDIEFLQRTGGKLVNEAVPITITAATPEPGSFVLLGTGLLGALGVARRRFVA